MENRLVLTLAELEAFDSHSPIRTPQRRFLCPLCGDGKPKDAAHRSLSVRVADGVWNCQRCKGKGQLREHWAQKTSEPRRQQMTRTLSRAFEVDASSWNIPNASSTVPILADSGIQCESKAPDWKAIWADSVALEGTRGVEYLCARGLSPKIADAAGVRFCSRWGFAPALVFPFRDDGGEVVAVGGRTTRECKMSKPASGPKSQGAFWAYTLDTCAPEGHFGPFDERLPAILVCEAPLDALSLAQAGYPALALGGTSAPSWLIARLAFRRVALALDADDAGDKAATSLQARLHSFGARTHRLRPVGAKDWNAFLQQGSAKLADFLASQLLDSSIWENTP